MNNYASGSQFAGQLFTLIFTVLAPLVSIYAFIGTIPGIIFLILALTTKNTSEKSKYFLWAKIGLGGIVSLLILSIAFAIVNLAGSFLGFSLGPTKTP